MTRIRLFALVGLGLAIVGALGTAAVRIIAPAPFLPTPFGFDVAAMIAFVVLGLAWASMGTLLVMRRPGNAVGPLMVITGAGYALSMLSAALTFAFAGDGSERGLRQAQVAGWATVLFQLTGICLFAIAFIFPTGRTHGPRWTWVYRGFWVMGAAFAIISLFHPGSLSLVPSLQNPLGIGPDLRGDWPFPPVFVALSAVLLPVMGLSMATRYRTSGREERHQLKWFVLALGLSGAGLGVALVQSFVPTQADDSLGLTVYAFAGAVVPIAIAIAILRHRLYDIDRIIGRTVGYAVVTATLAATFAGVALAIGSVVGSQGAGETFKVAAATLVVLALFGRVRGQVQSIVDRRFDRSRYDAERTAAAFAVRLRSEVDMATVTTDLAATATSTVAPSSLSIWLRHGASRR